MNELLPKCNIGYRFGKITPDKKYWLCCGSVPSIGDYGEDGSFKKFWNSKKYFKLRKNLKNNLSEMNEEWNDSCVHCPHYTVENVIQDNLDSWENIEKYFPTEVRQGILSGVPMSAPTEFQFEVGNPCNHRCNFCWSWSKDMLDDGKQWDGWKEWSKHFIEFDIYKNIIDDLYSMGGCRWISISGGGEPFLVPKMTEMIKYTKEKGFYLKVFTNLSRLTDKQLKEIVDVKVDRLEINISAGTEKTYCDSRRLKPKDWKHLWERVDYINSQKVGSKPNLKYVVILTNENIVEVRDIFRLAEEKGFNFLDFRVMIPSYSYDKLLPSKEQIKVFNDEVKVLSKKYNLEFYNEYESIQRDKE